MDITVAFQRNNYQNRTMGTKWRNLDCLSRRNKMVERFKMIELTYKTNKQEAKNISFAEG
jgi:hypothetical protein